MSTSAPGTPSPAAVAGEMSPGTPCADAPVARADGQPDWLLHHLGDGFVLMVFGAPPSEAITHGTVGVRVLAVGAQAGADLRDSEGLLERRYDARPGTVYLIRPDQHVAARWRRFDAAAVRAALARALGC